MNTIYIIRTSLGYSQEYVASKLKVSQQSYSHLEKNPFKITVERLHQLSEVFQIEAKELLPSLTKKIIRDYSDIKKHFPDLFFQKSQYENQIKELKEEVVFLKNIISSLSKA